MAISTRAIDDTCWDDVAAVFGPSGGSGGCWCTFWRLTNVEAALKGPEDNKAILRAAVEGDGPVGVLAHRDGVPAGWCSVAPREVYHRIERTKGLEPDSGDEKGVWSVVCLFVAKEHRGAGVVAALLPAAVEFARDRGASILEAYPVKADITTGAILSSGTIAQFADAGFALHRSPAVGRRVIMRRPTA